MAEQAGRQDQGRRGGGQGGPGGQGGRRGPRRDKRRERDERQMQETVVKITRNAKVVKGGRRFTFGALVVVGDGKQKVGIGRGKANGVPIAVEKGVKAASKAMFRVGLVGDGTIPHATVGRYRSSKVMLRPAAPGTGVIAGAAVKAVLVAAGVQNILTKVHGSSNPVNVLKATECALKQLRTREQIAELRGVEIDHYDWPRVEEKKAT